MGDFYITLSSNVDSDFFPDNKLTHFHNKLGSQLDLNDGEYLIGLAEIQLPFNWKTIGKNEAYMDIFSPVHGCSERVYVDPGYYLENTDLIKFLNTGCRNLKESKLRHKVTFRYHKRQQRAALDIKPDITVTLNEKLN